jgi:hypothetical protein
MVPHKTRTLPFGCTLEEYRLMFALTEGDLGKRILGVGDGAASFNAELCQKGGYVTSVDPLYANDTNIIKKRLYDLLDHAIAQVAAAPANWVWSYHRSPDHLRKARIQVLNRFLADYPYGRADGRYLPGELPRLAFMGSSFDLALCSHFLFLYSDQLSYEYHLASVRELLRLADEVRIFPLVTNRHKKSPYLDPLIGELKRDNVKVSIEASGYEFQKGADQFLRIKRPQAFHDKRNSGQSDKHYEGPR